MNYKQAKLKSYILGVVGVIISIPAFLSTLVSFFKYLYFGMSDGSQIGEAFTRPFKQISYFVYERTSGWLGFFWERSPTPDIFNIKNPHNVYFLLVFGVVGIGMAIYTRGKKIAHRLRKIDREIQDQLIKESIAGKSTRTEKQIKHELNVEKPSMFSAIHTLYIAPIVVGLILLVTGKFMG